jgi:hypothetical protein
VAPLLEDTAPEVRAAALAGCARFGGVEGGIVAYSMLDRLLRSESPGERAVAATAMGRIGSAGFSRIFGRLLRDDAPTLRTAAVEAAAKLRDERPASALADQIALPELRAGAVAALQQLPDTAVTELAARLAEQERPLSERLGIVQPLAGIGGPHAVAALAARLAADRRPSFWRASPDRRRADFRAYGWHSGAASVACRIDLFLLSRATSLSGPRNRHPKRPPRRTCRQRSTRRRALRGAPSLLFQIARVSSMSPKFRSTDGF